MAKVADEVVLGPQVTLIHGHYEWQLVHVGDHLAVRVVHHLAAARAVADAVNRGQRTPVGNLGNREVELLPRHEVDGSRRPQRGLWRDGHFWSDEPDEQRR